MYKTLILSLLLLTSFVPYANAYIGPGAAVAFLGYAFGPIIAIVVSIGLVFAWFGRMIWVKVKSSKKAPESTSANIKSSDSTDKD